MLTPLALVGGGLLILGIKYVAEHRTGPLAWVAGAIIWLGTIAVVGAVIAALVAGAAVFALIAVVFAFMIPLALLGGSVGNGSRGVYPRRYY
ncbi:hypothetical protein [Rhodococcus sp. UNC23MFCrub1.1]|uniref:hypothetical protein n=1 Tax=Rhodococcus sp. UNC23MFCrub1.1 TaxID=1449068 RepID=UPI000485C5B9|nr:hypothetical protein [Rhodococcus sp. UNC23MFCrub1.1]